MFDIVIEKGLCYAGDGGEPFRADLGIKDGKIEEIGDLSAAGAARKIDASGLSVSPGFHRYPQPLRPGGTRRAGDNEQDRPGDNHRHHWPGRHVPCAHKGRVYQPVEKAMAGLEGSYEVDWTWRTSAEYSMPWTKCTLAPNLAYLAPFGNLRMCAGPGRPRIKGRDFQNLLPP